MTDKKAEAPKASEPKEGMTKTEQAVMDEYRRTRKLRSGWGFNVRDGVYKLPKKDK